MKNIMLVAAMMLVLWPASSRAELPEQLLKNFAPISGQVLMQLGDKYMIDLDAGMGLRQGDILSLVVPGKKIADPETRVVVSASDTVLGFLRVERIHSGYSYVKPLDAEMKIEDGASLKRFAQVPARVVDASTDGTELKRQLMANLPHFSWLGDNESEEALVLFVLNDESLVVKNAVGDSLQEYVISENQLVSPVASEMRPIVTTKSGPEPLPLQKLANTVSDLFTQSNEDRFAEMDQAIFRQRQAEKYGLWMSPNIAGQGIGVAVADLNGDGEQEIAVVLEEKIVVAKIIDGKYKPLAEVKIPLSLQMVSVDAVDTNNDNAHELVVTAFDGTKPSSFVVEFSEGRYDIVIEDVRWLLRALPLPGRNGEQLIGQRIDNSTDVFRDKVFRVSRDGDKLVRGETLNLPKKLNVFNFLPFADKDGQIKYAYLTKGDYLKVVNAAGVELWESDQYFGGSENAFYNRTVNSKDDTVLPTYVAPKMFLMPNGEIVVVQNDGQRVLQGFRKFGDSRLVSLDWNGVEPVERWQTASQPGYTASASLADADNDGDNELVLVVIYERSWAFGEARSAVLVYEVGP